MSSCLWLQMFVKSERGLLTNLIIYEKITLIKTFFTDVVIDNYSYI